MKLRPLFYLVCYILFCVAFLSCRNKNNNTTPVLGKMDLAYASGFEVKYYPDYTEVIVFNPWQKNSILQNYILVERGRALPDNLPEGTLVRVPVEKIACLYSTDASVIHKLAGDHKVIAMAETKYVKLPFLKEGLKNGKIVDIGMSTALDIEKLLEVNPDIIIVSPFQNMGYDKLETTGIAIVENAAYMENTPLAYLEWMRFIGVFLQKDVEADSIISFIAGRYNCLREKVADVLERPTVFSERKYGDAWYVPGGDSYMANFFYDAGANYIWKENKEKGSLTLDFEKVYEKAEEADFWLVRGDRTLTYKDMKQEFEPYSYFKAWKEKKIIFSNTFENDYYEEGMLNPDIILEDLLQFFHPEFVSPGRIPVYFEWMKDEK